MHNFATDSPNDLIFWHSFHFFAFFGSTFLAFFSLFCIFWVNWAIFRSSTVEKNSKILLVELAPEPLNPMRLSHRQSRHRASPPSVFIPPTAPQRCPTSKLSTAAALFATATPNALPQCNGSVLYEKHTIL